MFNLCDEELEVVSSLTFLGSMIGRNINSLTLDIMRSNSLEKDMIIAMGGGQRKREE